MFPEDDTALNEDGTPVEVADDEGAAAEDDTTATGDDTAGSDDAAGTEDKKEPGPVPHHRLQEEIDKRHALEERELRSQQENERLLNQVSDLTKALSRGETVTKTDKVEAKEDIESLVKTGDLSRADADKFIRVLNAAGVKRASEDTALTERLDRLEKENASLKNVVYGGKDAEERSTALKEYDGIVTAKQLDDTLKSWANSRDPELVNLSRNASYKTIIEKAFFKEIMQHEVDKVTGAKKKPAPKVDAGKGRDGPRKPQTDEVFHDPSNPQKFGADLRKSIKAQMASSE